MPERLWERQQGESGKAFEAFETFRRMGPDRSLQATWEQYYGRPGTLRERTRKGREEAGEVVGYFRRWYKRWQWEARALAWDEEVAALARDQELDGELKARMAEQEEERRQRQLRKEEARAARAVARRALLRLLQGVEEGQLEGMRVPELLPHLQKIAGLLDTGQKLDRLSLGEPTDLVRCERRLSPEVMQRLGEMLRRYVPPERWGELAEELIELDPAPEGGS